MKRGLLITMMAVVMTASLTACGGDKNTEVTTAVPATEAASEVKNEFIQFIGTDIPGVETKEKEVMQKYNAYFAEGSSVDVDALQKDLSENLIPQYEEFLKSVEAIEVKTDEVKNLKDQYYDSMNTQYQALQKIEAALKNKDKDVQSEAQNLLADAKKKYTAYNDAVYALAQEENVTLKGDIATTATTESSVTTEANTEAIDQNEVMVDDTPSTTEAETEAE